MVLGAAVPSRGERLLASLAAAGLLVLASTPALADLPEPEPNQGATQIEVEGTVLRAEGWAIAQQHVVETLIVARLDPSRDPDPDAEPSARVTTYETWSLDGRRHLERGERALRRHAERLLGVLIEQAAKPGEKPAAKPKGESLLERLARTQGASGSATVDGYIVGWSLGTGRAVSGNGTSKGSVAIVTLVPAPIAPLAPVRTPRADEPKGECPVTPTPKEGAEPGPPRPLFPTPGPGSSAGRALASGSANSEEGVRQHGRFEMDLGAIARLAPVSARPTPVTPKAR